MPQAERFGAASIRRAGPHGPHQTFARTLRYGSIYPCLFLPLEGSSQRRKGKVGSKKPTYLGPSGCAKTFLSIVFLLIYLLKHLWLSTP